MNTGFCWVLWVPLFRLGFGAGVHHVFTSWAEPGNCVVILTSNLGSEHLMRALSKGKAPFFYLSLAL
jgi:hypothetical protein